MGWTNMTQPVAPAIRDPGGSSVDNVAFFSVSFSGCLVMFLF